MFINDQKQVYLSQDFSSLRGNAKIYLQLPGQTTVDIFAGLETKSDAVVRIVHNYLGQHIEDLKLYVSLVGGFKLSNTLEWRIDTVKDLQFYLKWMVNNLGIDSVGGAFDDLKVILVLKTFSLAALDDLTQRTVKVDYEALRRDLVSCIESVYQHLEVKHNINKELLRYVTDSFSTMVHGR